MGETDLTKVLTIFEGISAGDVSLATKYIDPKRFAQHNQYAADGVGGLAKFINESPRNQLQLTVVRAFQEGPYVVTHATGQRSGRNIFFDIFRFEGGLVVEHWAFSTMDAPPNQSGHTQTDGPTDAKASEDTEENKAIVREYYETIHIAGEHDKIPQYFSGDHCIRHEPGVSDGVQNFKRDLAVLVTDRSIDAIKFIFGQRDFVFIAAKGSHKSRPCVYIDLYRVEQGKIAERWGFPEEVPPQEEWKNQNGIL
jgi:predicted SnoaL-like aldol condensation-catalyzing enzyme